VSNTASQPPSDQRGYQDVLINDFSPGIYSGSWIASLTPTSSPGPYPAPMGAADGNETVGCMNLPTGGLGPLPAMVMSHTPNNYVLSTPLGASQSLYSAVFSTAFNADNTGGDELVIVQSYVRAGGTLDAFLLSVLFNTVGAVHIIAAPSKTGIPLPASGVYPLTACFPFTTRVSFINPTTTVGQQVAVFPICDQDFGGSPSMANFGLYLYPDPANPSTYSNFAYTGTDYVGFAFGHQGRVVALPMDPIAWATQPGTTYAVFDTISYSDPANSETYGNQNEVFGPENPYGYGGITSVSAGELFMIKCRGGAIVVQGDLNQPTITTLPAVKSTGPIYGQIGTDPNGSYYCAEHEGAWVWNGGNSSQKISTQLDDDFFVINDQPPSLPGDSGFPGQGIQAFGYFCQRWGPWMMFSNNWVYNTGSGGWWRLYDPNVASFFFYTIGYHPDVMYAAVPAPATDTTPFIFKFDRTVPSNNYTWQSLPIRPNAQDRTIDVRSVTVRAANVTLDTNAQIAVYLIDSQGNTHQAGTTWTLSSTTTAVQIQNFNIGRAQTGSLEDIRLRAVVSATSAGAPVIYDFTVSYRTREQAGRT
jgi:hypothetical protein